MYPLRTHKLLVVVLDCVGPERQCVSSPPHGAVQGQGGQEEAQEGGQGGEGGLA